MRTVSASGGMQCGNVAEGRVFEHVAEEAVDVGGERNEKLEHPVAYPSISTNASCAHPLRLYSFSSRRFYQLHAYN